MLQQSWTLLGSRYVAEYRVLRVREDRYRFEPSGVEADFVVCDSADWALVVPLTPDDQVVFVRQFRHGVRAVVLEIPGGLIDAGETPEAAAVRELREETGYTAERVHLAGGLIPNPALNNATCHVVLAEGCRPGGNTAFDPLERIDIELRPLQAVPEMIRRGELRHAQAVACFALLEARGLIALDRRAPPA
jgi:ADP-ribose pyrophosphatase